MDALLQVPHQVMEGVVARLSWDPASPGEWRFGIEGAYITLNSEEGDRVYEALEELGLSDSQVTDWTRTAARFVPGWDGEDP